MSKHAEHGDWDVKIYERGPEDLISDWKYLCDTDADWKHTGEHLVSRTSFIGREFDGLDQYFDDCFGPWAEGVDAVDAMLAELGEVELPKPMSRQRRRRWSEDDGQDVDFDRLRAGQQYWRQLQRRRVQAPAVVTIIADVACNCHIDWRSAMWRAAAAITLTELLEAQGFRVDLWGAQTQSPARNGCDGSKQTTFVRVKEARSSLNKHSVVQGLSPWFFRTVLFAACSFEKGARENDRARSMGLGVSVSAKGQEVNRLITGNGDEKHVVIADCWDKATAVRVCEAAIKDDLGLEDE